LRGDEIVVAIQEERLSHFKRHRIRGAGPSKAVAYCLDYAGIEPSELSLVVLCVQGRLKDEIHDIRREPLLNIVTHNTPTLAIPHHYGHAFSAFATSGFKESAVLVVDGAFLLRPELRLHWDYVVWLEVDTETLLARACARDVAWVGDADVVEQRYRDRIIPSHELYEVAVSPRDLADAVIDTRDLDVPRLLRCARPR